VPVRDSVSLTSLASNLIVDILDVGRHDYECNLIVPSSIFMCSAMITESKEEDEKARR
jgi:hypothetical protein